MQSYDLTLSDNKTFRCVCLESAGDEAEDMRQIVLPFQTGPQVVSVKRVITPPPTKLPWKRSAGGLWVLGRFILSKLPTGEFHCFWPGGEAVGGKDEISAAVRANWSLGC